MIDNEPAALPNLVPQKTNVLTGSVTNYYGAQSKNWNNTYEQLVRFQKKRELESLQEEADMAL